MEIKVKEISSSRRYLGHPIMTVDGKDVPVWEEKEIDKKRVHFCLRWGFVMHVDDGSGEPIITGTEPIGDGKHRFSVNLPVGVERGDIPREIPEEDVDLGKHVELARKVAEKNGWEEVYISVS